MYKYILQKVIKLNLRKAVKREFSNGCFDVRLQLRCGAYFALFALCRDENRELCLEELHIRIEEECTAHNEFSNLKYIYLF